MPDGIEIVTVIGAGTMGAAIAGHLANAGLHVNLLDVAPAELTPKEASAGLSLDSPKVRNRIVNTGFERMVNARPANLFVPAVANRIRLGNLADDFEPRVAEADWIIEAIVEKPEPKQALMARIEPCSKPTAIISTNTSGIPIGVIADGRDPGFVKRFMGTHFFNPPRYMHLLELIPTQNTDPNAVQRMARFLEQVVGKGVVICKDTPNFIANRMLSFIQSDILDYAIANNFTVEEVDHLSGTLLGRPRSATFRLNDIVGIDVISLVLDNLYARVPEDRNREILGSPQVTAVLQTLRDHGHLGSKTGQGFYKTVVDEGGSKSFWGLNLQAAAKHELDYVPPCKPHWPSVEAARNLLLPDRLRALIAADDAAAQFVWHTLSRTLAYATHRVPEVTDSIVDVDNAMKWGFGWEMGPFETWDALGVGPTVERMESEGIDVAPWVHNMLSNGIDSFYSLLVAQEDKVTRTAYFPVDGSARPIQRDGRAIHIPTLKHANRTLAENDSASLLDLGDGVILAEFHSKMNTFDEDVFRILRIALEKLHQDATGLVIGNQGRVFSAGLNLAAVIQAAQSGRFDYVERIIREGQDVFLALREAPKPVVAAVFQRALGGGAEIALAADRIVAHAETYMGLVEVGVGLVPGWGGCKELVRRHVSPHMHAGSANPAPHLRQVFQTIGFAKVSTSAQEAKGIGYLSAEDRIVMNEDHLLHDAKHEVLALAEAGYRPPGTQGTVFAAGRDALAGLLIDVHALQRASHITDYDADIARRLAHVLCGGDLSEPAWMDEQYSLDLEREAILTLAGQAKTVERILYMLQNGRPLRN